ncbi:MAG: 4a-hydroxytetrahydrobiopterin dehydratase [Fimbriimonadaceae bacterium]|nr:4a-hydroxytetrahydrobiopterin dehydratase [Fimbriimonadaceae bacterium]
MSDLSYNKLSSDEIESSLKGVPGWNVEDGALTRTWEFDSYASGAVFAGAVAHLADSFNHHPDLTIGYQKVTVTLRTHDAGGGLTSYDFELARRINDRL